MNNVDNDCNFQNTEKYLYLGANLIQWNDSKVLTCSFFSNLPTRHNHKITTMHGLKILICTSYDLLQP